VLQLETLKGATHHRHMLSGLYGSQQVRWEVVNALMHMHARRSLLACTALKCAYASVAVEAQRLRMLSWSAFRGQATIYRAGSTICHNAHACFTHPALANNRTLHGQWECGDLCQNRYGGYKPAACSPVGGSWFQPLLSRHNHIQQGHSLWKPKKLLKGGNS
jgi:hypothetical protein